MTQKKKKKKNCPQLQTTPQGLFSWTDQEASGCCPSLPRMAVPGRYGVPDDHLPCSMLFRGPVSGPLEPDQTAEDANPVLEFSPRYLRYIIRTFQVLSGKLPVLCWEG